MLSVEERQSFSIFIETKIDIKSDYLFFEFVIQYSNVYQASISRVITIRLPTVDSVFSIRVFKMKWLQFLLPIGLFASQKVF